MAKRKGGKAQGALFTPFMGGFFDSSGKEVSTKTQGRQLEFGVGNREPIKKSKEKPRQGTFFNPRGGKRMNAYAKHVQGVARRTHLKGPALMRKAAAEWGTGSKARRNPAAYPMYATQNPLGLSAKETKIALGAVAAVLLLDIGGIRSRLLGGGAAAPVVGARPALAAAPSADANIIGQQTGRVVRNSSGL